MTDKDMCENCTFKNKCEKYKYCLSLQEKLEIAIKALESLRTKKTVIDKVTGDVCYIWDYAIEQIKELDK